MVKINCAHYWNIMQTKEHFKEGLFLFLKD